MSKNLINVHIMIGIPGSGKSTFVKNQSSNGSAIISSDDIRDEFDNKLSNKEVFDIVHKRLDETISLGIFNDIYVDATNLTKKNRRKYFEIIKKHKEKDVVVIAEMMATKFLTCILRNQNRERKVPPAVIYNYHQNFQPPTLEEGFNKINNHLEGEE